MASHAWSTAATTATRSAPRSPSAASPPASRPRRTASSPSLRQGALPPAPPHRDRLRPPQGLATHRNPLRPMPHHLLRRHHTRRHRHLLARTMSPEPSLQGLTYCNHATFSGHPRPELVFPLLGRSPSIANFPSFSPEPYASVAVSFAQGYAPASPSFAVTQSQFGTRCAVLHR
jgi:hypothetical protein